MTVAGIVARKFTGAFTQQAPLPVDALQAAMSVLENGRLHRYNLSHGEIGEVAALEAEYRDWQGSDYCLAVTSGGQALQIALRACGVAPGDAVLTNAFTLAPVPGAISAVAARPFLVEVTDRLRLCLRDLEHKIATTSARYLLVSHMRGHLCDMEALMAICNDADVTVIEDCAHTMGALWNGKRSGNFGQVACFSTQTYKHLNAGEGGLLTTNDAAVAARATILSGSYMHFDRHGAGPQNEDFAELRYQLPNCSARMDALRAAVLRPQLRMIDKSIAAWNRLYSVIAQGLSASNRISTIDRPAAETQVGSSIQFRIPGFTATQCEAVLVAASTRGVELKWFGGTEPLDFTSTHQSWRFMEPQMLPRTDSVLATLFDMRLPLTFSTDDCALVSELICESVDEVAT